MSSVPVGSAAVNRQLILAERPTGPLEQRHFRLRSVPIPEPAQGEVLTRTLLLSIDPANRVWIGGPSYRPAVAIGGPMDGYTLSRVEISNHPDFAPGDLVQNENGWQDYKVCGRDELRRLAWPEPLPRHLGALGMTGLTAYFGMIEIGRPGKGDCVVVSSAAGAVGSVAGQIARIAGCRVVGIAGGAEKCRWLTEDLGFDAAIDHKATGDLGPALETACPEGIDVYFDNVGGRTLQAALFAMRTFGRIVCCGSIADYETPGMPAGPIGVPALLVGRRLRMQGFLVTDFRDRWPEAEQELAAWMESGRLVTREDVVDGLERAPAALIEVLHGANFGKRVVRVDLGGGLPPGSLSHDNVKPNDSTAGGT